MAASYRLELFSPWDITNPPDGQIRRWNDFDKKFLAQGDSWFSIGTVVPFATSNILQELRLGFEASVINCAAPGRHLARMVEWKDDLPFSRLSSGQFAHSWDGILLSGGGNDLIVAANILPTSAGDKVMRALLLGPDKWRPAAHGYSRYLSEDGWETFSRYLADQFEEIVVHRDSGINKNVPLFCHTYAYPMPRNAPVSRSMSMGPWLYPSMVAYKIPNADWFGVASELIDRLAALLGEIITSLAKNHRHVYLIETHKTAQLDPATPESRRKSGDWQNEIHPTRNGYRKLANGWRTVIEARIPSASPVKDLANPTARRRAA